MRNNEEGTSSVIRRRGTTTEMVAERWARLGAQQLEMRMAWRYIVADEPESRPEIIRNSGRPAGVSLSITMNASLLSQEIAAAVVK